MPEQVLFACIQNAGRSQIAKYLFNHLVDPSSASAISAGSRPADHVHPEVIEVMDELGLDVSQAEPQKLTQELAATCQVLVTMGCGEACPYVPGLQVIDWQIPDPHARDLAAVRAIRDHIKGQLEQLIKDRGYTLRNSS